MIPSKHRELAIFLGLMAAIPILAASADAQKKSPGIQVGAAAADIAADDSMADAGGIFPRYLKGQEGRLRASAIVIHQGKTQLCMVSCDVLELSRAIDDAAADEIKRKTGISAGNVLITATHTHSAPATDNVHMVQADPVFSRRTQEAIVQAATQASQSLETSRLYFALGDEATVGQNSRLRLTERFGGLDRATTHCARPVLSIAISPSLLSRTSAESWRP